MIPKVWISTINQDCAVSLVTHDSSNSLVFTLDGRELTEVWVQGVLTQLSEDHSALLLDDGTGTLTVKKDKLKVETESNIGDYIMIQGRPTVQITENEASLIANTITSTPSTPSSINSILKDFNISYYLNANTIFQISDPNFETLWNTEVYESRKRSKDIR